MKKNRPILIWYQISSLKNIELFQENLKSVSLFLNILSKFSSNNEA